MCGLLLPVFLSYCFYFCPPQVLCDVSFLSVFVLCSFLNILVLLNGVPWSLDISLMRLNKQSGSVFLQIVNATLRTTVDKKKRKKKDACQLHSRVDFFQVLWHFYTLFKMACFFFFFEPCICNMTSTTLTKVFKVVSAFSECSNTTDVCKRQCKFLNVHHRIL